MGNTNGNRSDLTRLERDHQVIEDLVHAHLDKHFPDYSFGHKARLRPLISKTLTATAHLLVGDLPEELSTDIELSSLKIIEQTPLTIFDELEVAITMAVVSVWPENPAATAAAAIKACNIWYDAFWPFENPQAIAQAARIGNIANALPSPTFLADIDGRLTFVSYQVEEVLNLTEGALEGKHMSDIFNIALEVGADKPTISQRVVRGHNRTFRTTVLPNVTSAGIEFFGVIDDITSQVELNEIRSGVLNVMSHEMRTPLTTIMGYLELLNSGQLDAADFTRAISDATAEAQRLNALISNVVDFAKFAGGTTYLNRSRWAVEETIERIVARVSEGRSEAPTVDVELGLVIFADSERFETVLDQLLLNAQAHGAKPIAVSARSVGGGVEVVVSDSGPGYPFANPTTAMDAFVTGHRQPGQGAGLGLTICESIMLAHQGNLSLSNRGGAQAIAWFPPHDPDADPTEE